MTIFSNISFRRCKKYFIKDAGIVAKALYDYCRITKAGCNVCKIEKQCKAFIESIPYLRFAIVDATSPKNDNKE
jgi:hypothetical protein